MTPADIILKKVLVASALPSSDWERIRAGIRDRAFFSSRIENARFLHSARKAVADVLAESPTPRGTITTRRDAIDAIMAAARREGISTERGGLTDPGSMARAKVILDTNAGLAAGAFRHAMDVTPGAMLAFPAKELARMESSHPRMPRNWAARWRAAGGRFFDGGRMIALVSDPIWAAISRFGQPYPPFDYNSGMTTYPVSRDECLSLGVIEKEWKPQRQDSLDPSGVAQFNDGLSADVPFSNTSVEWQQLKSSFGDQIRYQNGRVVWRGEIMREVFESSYGEKGGFIRLGAATDDALAKVPTGFETVLQGSIGERMGLTITKDLVTHVKDHNHYKTDPRKTNIPLIPQDLDLVPMLWRSPDRITPGNGESLLFELDLFDGGILVLPVLKRGNTIINGTLYKKEGTLGRAVP